MSTNVNIKSIGINGEGIGFYRGKPIFIDATLPDEQVICDNIEYKGKYYKGELKKVITPSKYRVEPICKKYKYCDGCSLLHCKYEQQLQYKQQLLIESLDKYSNVNTKLVKPLIHSNNSLGYRNQVKLAIKQYDDKTIHAGLFTANSNHFIGLDDGCVIHNSTINKTIKIILSIFNKHKLKEYDNKTKKGLRGLVIRYIDEQLMITIVSGNDKLNDNLIKEIKDSTNVKVLAQSILTSKNYNSLLSKQIIYHTSEHYINVKLNDYKFAVSPLTFFQLNTDVASLMINYINLLLDNDISLYEGYCGVGIISLCCSKKIKKGYGVEIVNSSIDCAKRNAKLNHIDNIEYKVGDSGEELKYLAKKNKFDTILVDPARSGLDKNMINSIIKSNTKTLIYVSCNISSLAKNLNDLSKYYKVVSIQPFDMFSNTSLVETVVKLVRK